MENTVYKKSGSADRPTKKVGGYTSLSFLLFIASQYAIYFYIGLSANRWFTAMWTLISFDNLFVTASLVACGLTAVSCLFMLVGLILMWAGKRVGRFLGLIALIATGLGALFLGGAVVFNAINTNTALVSLINLYFLPLLVAAVNAIVASIFLLRSEGLKEHLAYKRKPKHEPPRTRLPEQPPVLETAEIALDSIDETPMSIEGIYDTGDNSSADGDNGPPENAGEGECIALEAQQLDAD